MENEWIAALILTGILVFGVTITCMIKNANRKIEESEIRKDILKNGIELIKQKWKSGKY